MQLKKLSPRAKQALKESKIAILPQAAPVELQLAVHIPPGKPTALRLHTMPGHASRTTFCMRSRVALLLWLTAPRSQASPTSRARGKHCPTGSLCLPSMAEHWRLAVQVHAAKLGSEPKLQ